MPCQRRTSSLNHRRLARWRHHDRRDMPRSPGVPSIGVETPRGRGLPTHIALRRPRPYARRPSAGERLDRDSQSSGWRERRSNPDPTPTFSPVGPTKRVSVAPGTGAAGAGAVRRPPCSCCDSDGRDAARRCDDLSHNTGRRKRGASCKRQLGRHPTSSGNK